VSESDHTDAEVPAASAAQKRGVVLVLGGGEDRQAALEAAGHVVYRRGWHEVDGFTTPVDLIVVTPGEGEPGAASMVRSVRDRHVGPVLAVLEGSTETERVRILNAGADDCVDRVGDGELLARVAALLRRIGRPEGPAGSLAIDMTARTVEVGGHHLDLTRREFDLLARLATNPRRVFTRQQLLEQVWPATGRRGPATVTEHVRRLRRKIAAAGVSPEGLETIRGVGYRLDPEGFVPLGGPGVERRREVRRRDDREAGLVVLPELAETSTEPGSG
jgi:DNA-binding response OmpR family regulator